MIWYVRRGEREIGPLGDDALRALVGTGQITRNTQLWREGLSGWTAAFALPGVLGPRAAAPLAPASLAPAPLAPASLRPASLAPASGPATAMAPDLIHPQATAAETGAAAHEPATPWRRYWARYLDISISTFLVAVLISAFRPSLLSQLGAAAGEGWIVLLLLLPFALTMDTLIYWALGNTPGKAIAGIKVLDEAGRRPLSAPAHLGRNFGMYVFGLGLGLPLISLITMILGYRRAAAGELSTWDRSSGSRVYVLSGAELRTWLTAGVYLIGVTALIALGLHAEHNNSRYTAARTPAPILQQELTQAANSVNARVPRMIDRITRLDGAHAGPGSLFTYEYTLTNMRAAQLSPLTLQTLRWRLSAHVRQAVCRGTALQPMLRTGTTVRFHYRDQDGRDFEMVSVSRADCGG